MPVLSPSEDQRIQFFTFFDSYRSSIERNETGSPIVQNMPDQFVYVDIGQGSPADDTGDKVSLEVLLAPDG